MSSPESNQPIESGAIQLAVAQPSLSSAVTRAEAPGDVIAPPSPTLSKPEPRTGDIAFRMISNFAAENLRQGADALEAGMPILARHHVNKALEQIDHLDRL
jgi:hypothetical protein